MNNPSPRQASPWRPVGGLLLMAATIGAVGYGLRPPKAVPPPLAPAIVVAPIVAEEVAPVPEPPKLNRAAVDAAEKARDVARRARDRAVIAAKAAVDRLDQAETEGLRLLSASRAMASTLRDPSGRIAAATARGERARAERDAVRKDLGALIGTPKPRRKPLVDKSPVASRARGQEYHFEVRGDRVAFIDLDKLVNKIGPDARMRSRMGTGGRPIEGTVGPVGGFSLRYAMVRSDLGDDPPRNLRESSPSYSLDEWEIVPSSDLRGDPIRSLGNPASDFGRAITRLSPDSSTITMWVYPDGFPAYRQVAEALRRKGFLVAARPLPDGTAIRGSPHGSLSAGQ